MNGGGSSHCFDSAEVEFIVEAHMYVVSQVHNFAVRIHQLVLDVKVNVFFV